MTRIHLWPQMIYLHLYTSPLLNQMIQSKVCHLHGLGGICQFGASWAGLSLGVMTSPCQRWINWYKMFSRCQTSASMNWKGLMLTLRACTWNSKHPQQVTSFTRTNGVRQQWTFLSWQRNSITQEMVSSFPSRGFITGQSWISSALCSLKPQQSGFI